MHICLFLHERITCIKSAATLYTHSRAVNIHVSMHRSPIDDAQATIITSSSLLHCVNAPCSTYLSIYHDFTCKNHSYEVGIAPQSAPILVCITQAITSSVPRVNHIYHHDFYAVKNIFYQAVHSPAAVCIHIRGYHFICSTCERYLSS